MTTLTGALPLSEAQLEAQVKTHLAPIFDIIPEDWIAYYWWNTPVSDPYPLQHDPHYIRSLALSWYREALRRHTWGNSWTQTDLAWIRAFPPETDPEEKDDLDYPTFIPIADFNEAYRTGELS